MLTSLSSSSGFDVDVKRPWMHLLGLYGFSLADSFNFSIDMELCTPSLLQCGSCSNGVTRG